MKRVFLPFLFFLMLHLRSQVPPTCSLDPVFIGMNKYGIWPDSATNFVSGTVGINYVQNITVKVPKDTVTQIGTFCFNRVVVSTPSNVTNYNLPPGLMFGSSTASLSNGTINGSPSLKFPGNANNCASIYGTPTQAGTFVLSFKVDTYATLSFGSCPNNPNINGGTNLNTTYINYYKIVIYPPSSVGSEYTVGQTISDVKLFPVPATDNFNIQFLSSWEFPYSVRVYDLNGRCMARSDGHSMHGMNKIPLVLENVPDGLYLVVLRAGNSIFTSRISKQGH